MAERKPEARTSLSGRAFCTPSSVGSLSQQHRWASAFRSLAHRVSFWLSHPGEKCENRSVDIYMSSRDVETIRETGRYTAVVGAHAPHNASLRESLRSLYQNLSFVSAIVARVTRPTENTATSCDTNTVKPSEMSPKRAAKRSGRSYTATEQRVPSRTSRPAACRWRPWRTTAAWKTS